MLDTKFIAPFTRAAMEVFKIQGGLYVQALSTDPIEQKSKSSIVISSRLEMKSTKINGYLCLCFEKDVFLSLMSNMLGERFTELTPDLHDGASEILNIIYGTIKTHFNNLGHDLKSSIPTVMAGDALKSSQSAATGSSTVIPLRAPEGMIFLEISLSA